MQAEKREIALLTIVHELDTVRARLNMCNADENVDLTDDQVIAWNQAQACVEEAMRLVQL